MGRKSLFLAVSLAISGLLLFQIFSQNTINQWPRLLAWIRVDLLRLYLVHGYFFGGKSCFYR